MSFHIFDRYLPGESLVHHLDPRAKVVAAGLFMLSTLLLPDGAWLAMLGTLGVLLVLVRWAGLPARVFWTRSLVILPFTLTGLTTLFITPGATLLAFSPGPWHLTITDAGVVRFLSIMARSVLALQSAILLTATTPFPDLLHALRHLHVPRVLVSILAFMYRYLFVLGDEAERLLRGRRARSARLPGVTATPGWAWRGRVTGHMVGQLFLRSLERGERVHQAMLARGYRGYIYTLHPHVLQKQDGLFLALTGLCLLCIQLLAHFV